jgi:hypothetical protein
MKRVKVTLHMLHHDHAIGAGGYRRACHYFYCLARVDHDRLCFARPNRANDLERQTCGEVGGTAGKSISRGACKRGLIPIGSNRFSQHHTQAIKQPNRLRRMGGNQPVSMLANDPAGLGIADHPGWSDTVQVAPIQPSLAENKPTVRQTPVELFWVSYQGTTLVGP